MLKIGVTGGIGTGKSWVCEIFKQLGIPVFEADLEVKKLYNADLQLKADLIATFGIQSYQENGEINREYLRQILSNPQERDALNKLVHPKVFQRFYEWSSQQKSPYVLKEAAILFESGADKTVDKSIGVFAPLEMRIARVMERDHRSREEVVNIIKLQMDQEELRSKVDYQIQNDNEQSVIKQVMRLHETLCNISPHFRG